MDQPHIDISRPILVGSSTILFSAFGFGWGYCSFALPVKVICEELGAADTSARQLALAFELGKQRIQRAVQQRAIFGHGRVIRLSSVDLLLEQDHRSNTARIPGSSEGSVIQQKTDVDSLRNV
ncbi:conserved hypothetical protein [Paraburkholderia ribeironis]|uniref:Uncharacterized protein n=1 Tax=Paraburkholderia ribeironis TaxID=1247936 RepID=A0A1N7RY16_9BURK|nr:hypothetical protein [Paraburkholderia ribeironis]SIT39981.1 conserved hypothetical protein [Paraburkholderia ribeironis]